jgi:transposase
MVMAPWGFTMAWLRIVLTEDQQRAVNEERDSHPQQHVRRKMLVLWLLHSGLTREKAAKVAGLGRATVQRYVAAFRDGGLEGLRHWGVTGHASDLAAHHERIREEFTRRPARSVAEACERIEGLVGIRRQPSQVRKFLKGMGLKFQRVRAIPVPPKKTLDEHVREQAEFLEAKLNPRLEEAKASKRHVFFVDAAHMVFGTFVCCLWSFARLFVRAASGRQRFNVLGAWDAVTRELVCVTNTTVVNTETMCELLRKLAAQGLVGPVTVVLDNARYQRNAVVQGLAASLGIELLFLPSYSPNLNLIERLWRFTKREALYGRYHATFADFQAAIQDVLGKLSTKHEAKLASLMTLNFQVFDDVSLMAA